MTYRLDLRLTGLPDLPNALRHQHWAKQSKHNKQWRLLAALSARAQGAPEQPLRKARLVLTRYSSHQPDPDGLAASFKPLVDGLRDALVLADDTHAVIGVPIYQWEQIARGKGHVRIEVEG